MDLCPHDLPIRGGMLKTRERALAALAHSGKGTIECPGTMTGVGGVTKHFGKKNLGSLGFYGCH